MHSFFIHSSFIFHTKLKQFSAHIHCQYHEHITPNMQDISKHKNGKNLSKLISLDSWTQVYDQINPENANNYFLEISQSYYQFFFHYPKDTPYLIIQEKIGVPQELSSLVRLNVNFMKYLWLIILANI